MFIIAANREEWSANQGHDLSLGEFDEIDTPCL
jgi:hypothetical protein